MSIQTNFPSINPSLLLDLVNTRQLDTRVTFTRSTTATYFDALGVLTTASANVPRFDYNPSTLAAQGLLFEEQRTNSIRNNTMVGAVAGTPGTLPTNWSTSVGGSGITRTLVGTGTENGITYIDFQFSGTGSGSAFQVINTETLTGIAAATGQIWSGSFYLKLVAGSTAGTNITMALLELASGSGVVQNLSAALSPTTQNLASQRNAYSATLSGGGTITNLQQGLRLLFTNGVAVDITLRIGLPQLELGSYATSVIPTTTTAATRNADAAIVNTLSPWYNASEGTFYSESVFNAALPASVFGAIWSFNNFPDDVSMTYNPPTNNTGLFVRNAGVVQTNLTAPVSIGAVSKVAATLKNNDFAQSVNGGAVLTDTSGTIPTITTGFLIGQSGANVTRGSQYIRKLAYYPKRLSNSELQALTS